MAPGELERAATQVVCEWAQKLMNAPFNSLLELAEFLVGHLYVNSKSAAAFTILAQMQAKGRRASVEPGNDEKTFVWSLLCQIGYQEVAHNEEV